MTELIPRVVLFGNPERFSPQISPDGKRTAWIAPKDGVLNVWVAPTGPDGVNWDAATVVTDDTDRGIRTFAWARDGVHLLYLQDAGGDENWRLYGVNPDTAGTSTAARRDLTPFDGIQARVVSLKKSHPGQVLIGINRDNPQLHDVYQLDLASGELVKIIENPGYAGWLADEDQVVRGALQPLPDGGFNLLVRDTGDGEWRTLLTISADDAPSSLMVSFSADGTSLLVISAEGSDTSRLPRAHLADGRVEGLLEDPEAEVVEVVLHPDHRGPQIVEVLKDRMEYHVVDPSVRADLDAVRALDSGDPSLIGRDEADTTWLISFNKDDGPARFFSYDRATRTGRFLFDTRPGLARYKLAAMEPFMFTARDGLTIHAYATFPVGAGRTALPSVLNVHGGPQGRDRSRVAIYGGSYGGYAALVGAAFTPDVFRCAVDIVGPSNLMTLLETIPPYWAPLRAQLYKRVGNPETDAEFLWSRSPLSRASDIAIPLLIAQGANDPRVKQAESEQIVAALKAAGIDHEHMLFPDEGHGFSKPENRLKFYAAAEKFLAKHMGGRFEE